MASIQRAKTPSFVWRGANRESQIVFRKNALRFALRDLPEFVIEFDNVEKKYGRHTVALDGVSFVVADGEFASIVGHSGAGKSTLVRLLIGEDKPTRGNVFFDSRAINKMGHGELTKLRRRVGVVFQEFRLLPSRTAWENVAFALEVLARPAKEIRETVPQVLKLVGLEGKEKRFPKELSGGERQRVAIARAMAHSPDVIIADEPTGNLDPLNSFEIARLLLKINELAKTSVILATHNRELVNAIGRRVITMDHGKVVRDEQVGKYAI